MDKPEIALSIGKTGIAFDADTPAQAKQKVVDYAVDCYMAQESFCPITAAKISLCEWSKVEPDTYLFHYIGM